MTNFEKILKWVAVLTILAVIIFFISKYGCNNKPNTDVQQQVHINDSLKKEITKIEMKSDSISKKNSSDSTVYSKKIDSLTKNQQKILSQAKNAQSMLEYARARLVEVLNDDNDTSYVVRSVADSLDKAATEINSQFFAYQLTSQQKEEAYQQEVVQRDSVIAAQKILVRSMVNDSRSCTTANDKLATDYSKLQRKEKVENTLTKIGGIATAVLAAIVLIKK